MGAIQQAFNQALSAATQIAAPQIAIKKGIAQMEAKEARELETAKKEAKTAGDILEEAVNALPGSSETINIAAEKAYQAEAKLYNLKPSLKGAQMLEEYKELYKPSPEKKAADSVTKTQDQYKDQAENINRAKEMINTIKRAKGGSN